MGTKFSNSNCHSGRWPFHPLFLILGTIFLVPNHNWVSADNAEICGTLYSKPKSQGIAFPLKHDDLYSDLRDDQRIFESGWTVTGSVVVESGCKMEVCNTTYLDGDCHTLDHGSHSVEENYFISEIASLQCTCEKQCNCSDIHIKKASCGRAYFGDGCRNCNALYAELDQSRNEYFPEQFSEQVTAIRLRKGCNLTYYPEEDFEGDAIAVNAEFLENFEGLIRSYECECSDELYEPVARPERNASYPAYVNIPESFEETHMLLMDPSNRNHPGLNAAMRSFRKKRSTKNAYILVLGSPGAGKSSAIKLLLDNENVTEVYRRRETHPGIREFRIPLTIDELGISNSELRIIDTPGIGRTDNTDLDADVLAALSQYLKNHEELKGRIPNAVLIFHKFTDNGYAEEDSNFISLIVILNLLHNRNTDQNQPSNVVFVLTHLSSDNVVEQRQPGNKLNRFKKTIQEHAKLPEPLHIVVAENRGKEQELPMMNGNFKLPNMEYYPRNLVEKLELIAENSGDAIGRSVFRNALRGSAQLTVTSHTFASISNLSTDFMKHWSHQFPTTSFDSIFSDLRRASMEPVHWKARIDKLEAKLSQERKARDKELEKFKYNILAEQMSLLGERLQAFIVEVNSENVRKARNDILKRVKADLKKLFE